MDEVTVITIVVMAGAPLLLGAIITIVLVAGRPRPKPGLGVRAPGTSTPTGRWNAQLLADSVFGRMGGTAGHVSGQFEVSEGLLKFFPEHSSSDVPLWALPCRELTARANGMFSPAGVVLWSPRGKLSCNVSREHINVWTRNSLKSMREPTYYREFVDVLVAHGARRG